MVSLTLSQRFEDAEAAAFADQLRAAPADWGCVAEETEHGWFLCAPTIDILLFNRLVGWGLKQPARRDEIEAALARFRAAGVTGYGVQLAPRAMPDDIPGWLTTAGLVRGDNWSKCYRAAGDVPLIVTDLRVEEIGPERRGIAASIVCAAFGMPPQRGPWIASMVGRPGWHHYLACDGSDAVAAAALFIYGDIGWLGVAGTLPGARRRGAQGALMQRRLTDGGLLGCKWFVTETGEDRPDRANSSFHNMMRLGFELAYQRPNFLVK